MKLHSSSRLEHGLDGLHAFSYLSTPAAPFSDGDLSALLLSARVANARLGVTGKLVVLEEGGEVSRFAQWIEGGRLELDACIERIRADPRHGEILVQYDGPIRARRFAAWDMVMEAADAQTFPTAVAEVLRAA